MLNAQKLLWLSDTHLNSIPFFLRERYFTRHVREHEYDAIVLTGDITTGKYLSRDLEWLALTLPSHPIYFVLGNHDYYGVGFQGAHERVRDVCHRHRNLIWLTDNDVVSLNSSVALVGHEGWYSGSYGDPIDLKWSLDWIRMSEMRAVSHQARHEMFNRLAIDSAHHMKRKVEAAFQTHETVIIATHFPPDPETTSATGRYRDFWLSYRTNKPMGDQIISLANENPERYIITLAGHTHIPSMNLVGKNLEFHVGTATSWETIPAKHVVKLT